MPRITASVPPPPLAPPASVRAQRRSAARTATITAPAQTRPDATTTPKPDPAATSAPAATPTTDVAIATLARLRSVTGLLAALGKTDADLERWLADGLPLRTYRTPDGERFADPADLLAALADRRPTTDAAVPAGASVTAVA